MKLSSIDMNLLVVLHTVLEEKSVVRAAEVLNVTPPAVSNSLARLRTIVGDPLFVRRGRSVVPTPRALELAPQLQTALAALTHALEERFDAGTTRRRFTLALSEADQACSAPEIAAAFTRSMPNAGLQITNLDTFAASDGLATGVIDAAMAAAPSYPLQSGTYAQTLYEDEAVLLVRKTHRVATHGRVSPKQFNALRYVDVWPVLGRPTLGRRVAEDFFARQGLKRDFALVVPSYFTAAMLAASSDLAVATPRRLAERFRTMLPLRILLIPGPTLRFHQQLIWHERTRRDPGATTFRELIGGVIGRRWRAPLPGST
jgi:DNA-binding transcriptional LysR family regulator